MSRLSLSLKDNKFPVSVCFNKVGAGSRNTSCVEAIIDTGATHTCISHSIIQNLLIPPTGEYAPTTTASGIVFNRWFPVHLAINRILVTTIPATVLFHPEHFLDLESAAEGPIPHAEIQKVCHLQGIAQPSIVYQKRSHVKNERGQYMFHLFRPGLGAEQSPCLIGMDILRQYSWQYSKESQELIIDC